MSTPTTTLHVSNAYDFEVGAKIALDAPNLTKWNRLLYWLIKKPIPNSKQYFVIVETCNDAALIIRPAIMGDK